MDPRWINSLGLVLGILGAILIWAYGLPPDVNRHGTSGILLEGTNQAEIEKGILYDFRSRAGLVCLIVSFALQLIATWMPSVPPRAVPGVVTQIARSSEPPVKPVDHPRGDVR
jgi:hypothetical protein